MLIKNFRKNYLIKKNIFVIKFKENIKFNSLKYLYDTINIVSNKKFIHFNID